MRITLDRPWHWAMDIAESPAHFDCGPGPPSRGTSAGVAAFRLLQAPRTRPDHVHASLRDSDEPDDCVVYSRLQRTGHRRKPFSFSSLPATYTMWIAAMLNEVLKKTISREVR